MNKKFITIIFVILLCLCFVGIASAGGSWKVSESGNGVVSGGYLPYYGVVESDIGWNFKWNSTTGDVNGHLNIVEKLNNGKVRHFKLYGYQVMPVEDPTLPWILFNCGYDGRWARAVRVEGVDKEGNTIAAHFRDSENFEYPNTIWYWVKDPSGKVITNTYGPLVVSAPFTMVCR